MITLSQIREEAKSFNKSRYTVKVSRANNDRGKTIDVYDKKKKETDGWIGRIIMYRLEAQYYNDNQEVEKYFMIHFIELSDELRGGKGYGDALYKVALQVAKENGAKGIMSNPEDRNRYSNSFWRKHKRGKKIEGFDTLSVIK